MWGFVGWFWVGVIVFVFLVGLGECLFCGLCLVGVGGLMIWMFWFGLGIGRCGILGLFG